MKHFDLEKRKYKFWQILTFKNQNYDLKRLKFCLFLLKNWNFWPEKRKSKFWQIFILKNQNYDLKTPKFCQIFTFFKLKNWNFWPEKRKCKFWQILTLKKPNFGLKKRQKCIFWSSRSTSVVSIRAWSRGVALISVLNQFQRLDFQFESAGMKKVHFFAEAQKKKNLKASSASWGISALGPNTNYQAPINWQMKDDLTLSIFPTNKETVRLIIRKYENRFIH